MITLLSLIDLLEVQLVLLLHSQSLCPRSKCARRPRSCWGPVPRWPCWGPPTRRPPSPKSPSYSSRGGREGTKEIRRTFDTHFKLLHSKYFSLRKLTLLCTLHTLHTSSSYVMYTTQKELECKAPQSVLIFYCETCYLPASSLHVMRIESDDHL